MIGTGDSVAICAIAKKENAYLREWVEYHKSIGVDKIYLYDNNDIDGEQFDDVIPDYIQSGFVTVISRRGEITPYYPSVQQQAYQHCYYCYNKFHQWMMFFDIDEFLEINSGEPVNYFFKRSVFKNTGLIHINWKTYTDNGYIQKNTDITVQNRFTEIATNTYEFIAVKSIIRCGYSQHYNFTWFSGSPHTIKLYKFPYEIRTFSGIQKKNSVIQSVDYSWGFLRHYPTKSLEEYVNKVRYRGFADGNCCYDTENRQKMIGYYYTINKRTPEKDKAFDTLWPIDK